MGNISKITLPIGGSNVTFEFADAQVRQTLAGGLQFTVCWDGSSAPVVADIPAGVKVTYQEEEYTGTKLASTAEPLTFYLVYSGTSIGSKDVYDEYVATGSSTKTWEKIGSSSFDFSSLKALAYKDEVILSKGSGHNVLGSGLELQHASSSVSFTTDHTTHYALGSDTTFAGQDSNVTITGTTKSKVLGTSTTFKAAASDVEFADDPTTGDALGANATFTTSVTSSNKHLKATATNMAISSDGNEAEVITGFGQHTTGTFMSQADPETKYLETVEVYGTDGTEEVSQVAVDEAAYLELASVPQVKYADNEFKTGSADTWEFTYDSNNNLLEISGANGSAMELESSDATVATGSTQSSATNAGAAIVTGVDITDVNVAKVAANATTIATGALTTSNDGAEVVYDLDTNSDSAITALGEAVTADALTGVTVTVPTIALELDNEATAGESVEVATAIASASTSVNADDEVEAITALAEATAKAQTITIDSKDEINAVTGIGTAVAAGQDITIGENDLVEVVTALGSAEAAGQTISVKTSDVVKVAEYSDLSVSAQ